MIDDNPVCVLCGVARPKITEITFEIGPFGNIIPGVVCSVCRPVSAR